MIQIKKALSKMKEKRSKDWTLKGMKRCIHFYNEKETMEIIFRPDSGGCVRS